MKRFALATILLIAATPSMAADKPPAELVAAREAFAAAVVKGDAAAAAKLSSFPLKNDVYREPKSIPEAKFASSMKVYAELKACLKSTPLRPAATKGKSKAAGATPDWELDCDGNILRFGLRNGQWLHTGYENVNE